MNFDYDKTFKILEKAKETLKESDSVFKECERELKYKYLISLYSKSYLSGSIWYIGDSIRKYTSNRNFRYVFT